MVGSLAALLTALVSSDGRVSEYVASSASGTGNDWRRGRQAAVSVSSRMSRASPGARSAAVDRSNHRQRLYHEGRGVTESARHLLSPQTRSGGSPKPAVAHPTVLLWLSLNKLALNSVLGRKCIYMKRCGAQHGHVFP
jgi:hypothetical protein